MSLLEHRILLVTGKGGVGKTTASVALGLAAAARFGTSPAFKYVFYSMFSIVQ